MVAVSSSKNKTKTLELCNELSFLATTSGFVVAETIIQNRESIHPAHYIGKGKLEYIKKYSYHENISYLIAMDDLTPTQKAEMEKLLDLTVIDRTGLILSIFARHATTKEGKMEIELAQLRYSLPKLKGKGNKLSNLGGGIGTRGPGEKKLEIDRRNALKRIAHLRETLKKLRSERSTMRKRRIESSIPLVSLVGYTNAGKTTLMNEITGSSLQTENKLFSTLETRVRRTSLTDGDKILLSDTVGFIRDLPHELMASFRSTLEEVNYADLLFVILDASEKDIDEKLSTVEKTLKEIGADKIDRIIVLNKIDLCTNRRIKELENKYPKAVFVSAEKSFNIQEMLERVQQYFNRKKEVFSIKIPIHKLSKFLQYREKMTVLEEKYTNNVAYLTYRTDKELQNHILTRL
ncbi:MAG: GTPase HflX [Kosmotogaceae bacterium]